MTGFSVLDGGVFFVTVFLALGLMSSSSSDKRPARGSSSSNSEDKNHQIQNINYIQYQRPVTLLTDRNYYYNNYI